MMLKELWFGTTESLPKAGRPAELTKNPMIQAAITALSLLGYDTTSLAHLYLRSIAHSSLRILSSHVSLDGERCCTAIFRSLKRCSIRFKSRPWLGHSRTFRDMSRSQSCVVLAVRLWPLSCWKVNRRPCEVPIALVQVFVNDPCSLLHSSLPQS